ncbi:MAG: hypothetical protein H7Z14_04865 [Anaerolineae bacterium]|nr:hypothetical protein [Phycisphaerae bacterium]
MMNDPRRHPDLFTEAEALSYLGIVVESESDRGRAIAALRENNGLVGMRFGGRHYMYHRAHLDDCVARTFGVAGSAISATPAITRGDKASNRRKEPALKLSE